ncbi:MAG: hypothetical protein HY795_15655 [Desulfovibrio sp.]|nr:hypothetical protein [Desulfovibrio sp.]MBI4958743.1 hypothetical protein [Desulfovibrio sp.]
MSSQTLKREAQVMPSGADDGDTYVNWFADELFQAIEPLRVAIDRMGAYHQDNDAIAGDMMVLERLLEAAESRLKSFDQGIADHFGDVGLYRATYTHPKLSPNTITGVRFCPR